MKSKGSLPNPRVGGAGYCGDKPLPAKQKREGRQRGRHPGREGPGTRRTDRQMLQTMQVPSHAAAIEAETPGRQTDTQRHTPQGGASVPQVFKPPASHLVFLLLLLLQLLPPAHAPASRAPTLFWVSAPEAAQHDAPGGARVPKQPQGPREHVRASSQRGRPMGAPGERAGGRESGAEGAGGRPVAGWEAGAPVAAGVGERRAPGAPALTCCGLGAARVPGRVPVGLRSPTESPRGFSAPPAPPSAGLPGPPALSAPPTSARSENRSQKGKEVRTGARAAD